MSATRTSAPARAGSASGFRAGVRAAEGPDARSGIPLAGSAAPRPKPQGDGAALTPEEARASPATPSNATGRSSVSLTAASGAHVALAGVARLALA